MSIADTETERAEVQDERVIALAQAEREAGVPDVQTAAKAAEAKKRAGGRQESEARFS